MASNAQINEQAGDEAGFGGAQVSGTDRVREDDASTLMNDERETGQNVQRCWSNFQVDSHNTSFVLESWEIISVRPTTELTGFKRIVGMKISSTYKVLKDRYTGVRAIPSYSQAELMRMVATAEREWTARQYDFRRLMKHETYNQNLARRIFELPACLPSKIGALLDCRFVATNKNPCIRRDWKVVMLKPMVGFMTDEGQQAHNSSLWSTRKNEPVQKWLVIIRGQDTRFNEKGFAAFNTMSNPWLRVDQGLQDRTRNNLEQQEVQRD